MIDLPFNPDDLGDTMLARYIRAEPERLHILTVICKLLDEDGRVGDHARNYIVRRPLRRAVFRGVLIALAIPLPSWAYERPPAKAANEQFLADYRARHGKHLHFPRSEPAALNDLSRPSDESGHEPNKEYE